MNDSDEDKLKAEINEIMKNVNNIMKNIEDFNPVKKEESTENKY